MVNWSTTATAAVTIVARGAARAAGTRQLSHSRASARVHSHPLPSRHRHRPRPALNCRLVSTRAHLEPFGLELMGPPKGYRPNVGVFLVNQENPPKVFMGERVDFRGQWQLVQGGVDGEETPVQAALRELEEETGISRNSVEVIGEYGEWLVYDFPPDVRRRISRDWGTDWKGQAQRWFLMRFKGEDGEVNLAGDGLEPAEFADWQWMEFSEVAGKAVEFKRAIYEKLTSKFYPLAASEDH